MTVRLVHETTIGMHTLFYLIGGDILDILFRPERKTIMTLSRRAFIAGGANSFIGKGHPDSSEKTSRF